MIEEAFDVQIIARGTEISIIGERESVERVERFINKFTRLIQEGNQISVQEIDYGLKLFQNNEEEKLEKIFSDVVIVTARGKQIKPKTWGQRKYIQAIRENDIVFGIGPAGTGKTYLAMAMAVAALRNKQVNRIILTRPAVEAGEKLGFLPGDLQEKVDPYLRPLYDALYDILGVETYQKLLEKNVIEVAPLAYMRGRTLDDSFIILDEAQNTTTEQMKMFLTRMGFGSKVVVTGDVTQIDLPKGKYSGLEEARKVLSDIKGIEFVYLSAQDVVRHQLVQKIIRAYELYDSGNTKEDSGSNLG
ncbi:MAG TPA: PhoH family protein [Clostridia bacterium]|nr:PhoH family protein [Clostridia bacterium]